MKGIPASGLIFSYPDKLIPQYQDECKWCYGYGLYVETGGEKGLPLIPEVQELLDWFLLGPTLPDKERFEMGQRIYAAHAEEQYVLNIVANSPVTQGVHVVNDDMRNVPAQAANSWPHRTPSTGYPEQFYYAK